MTDENYENIERLYKLMYGDLYIYALSTLRSDELAEEAVQETFRIACQKPDDLFNSPRPEGWLKNVLKNVMRNMVRKRESTSRLMSMYFWNNARNKSFTENEIKVELLFEDLAEREDFILLKEMAVEGRSYLEMSSDRGISVNACKKRVQRAKEELRKKLKNEVTKWDD